MKNVVTVLFCFMFTVSNLFAQWTEQTSGITTPIYSVSAVDDNVVWACGAGGKVLRTINSGVNWTVTTSPNPALSINTIRGINAMVALTAGSDGSTAYAFKTIDGGLTWTQTFNQPGGFINSITKFNGFPVCGMGGNPVGGRWSSFISFDFGSTWDSTGFYHPASPGEAGWNNSFCQPYDVGFFSFFGTNNTKIYQPFGNGLVLTHPTPGLVNSMAIWANNSTRIMTGSNLMLYSVDGGLSWTNVNAIGTGDILGITGAGSIWYYVRGSSVYKSTNDGGNWSNDYTASGTYNHIFLSPLGLYMWAVRSNGGISRYLFDIPLPVELSSFTSSVSERDVTLNWSTISETNNSGFEIERKDARRETNDDWQKINFVVGSSNSTVMNHYQFTDRGLNAGKYNYRLKQIDFNGNFNYHNLSSEVTVGVPEKFNLSQNYPNPFNPTTTINFDIPFDGNVNIKLYDLTGKEISKIVNEYKTAGYYTINFNASSLPSGVYIYRLSADTEGKNFSVEKKMMLVK